MTDEPVIRLDTSRYSSTVHGERTPDDPLYRARRLQDGFYFDAQGILIPDDGHREPWSKTVGNVVTHYQPIYTAEQVEQIEAIKERLRKAAPAPDGTFKEPPKQVSTNPKELEAAAKEVDLANWLRGREQHEWHVLQAAAARRGMRIQSKKALVEFLVDQGAVPIKEVAPEYQAYLKQDA